jgi:2,4-dienoyl-CoA reductase-like NADH-dependent reductase (Old Yellow Enzyme family)
MERGDFDLMAVGRGLLADPQWSEKIRRGAVNELQPYTADMLRELN